MTFIMQKSHTSFGDGRSIDRQVMSNGHTTISRTRYSTGGDEPLFNCHGGSRRHEGHEGHRMHGEHGHRSNRGFYAAYRLGRQEQAMRDRGLYTDNCGCEENNRYPMFNDNNREYMHHRTNGEKFGDSLGSIGNGIGIFARAVNYAKNIFNW